MKRGNITGPDPLKAIHGNNETFDIRKIGQGTPTKTRLICRYFDAIAG
jgi:hypothetical protein